MLYFRDKICILELNLKFSASYEVIYATLIESDRKENFSKILNAC